MIDRRILLSRILVSTSAGELLHDLDGIGVKNVFWQEWLPEIVNTWDAMPAGFIEHYYGFDADQDCAIAWAVRRRWSTFTFCDARMVLGENDKAKAAQRVWEAFGVNDGIVAPGGRGTRYTATIIAVNGDAAALLKQYSDVIAVTASRFDSLLMDSNETIPIPRAPAKLSDRQLDVLRVQIERPELTLQDQAQILGISTRMLQRRHAQIAQRFGVSSFSGAVVKAVEQGVDRPVSGAGRTLFV